MMDDHEKGLMYVGPDAIISTDKWIELEWTENTIQVDPG